MNSIKARIVTTIAPKNPVWCRPLMINHVTIKTMTHANQLPRNKNVRAKTMVKINDVAKTCPNSLCLALLNKFKASLRKIAINIRKIK